MVDDGGGEDLFRKWRGAVIDEELEPVGLVQRGQYRTAPVLEVWDQSWVAC